MKMLTRNETRDEINGHIPITDYLTKARNGGYICPYCSSGTGPNGTGAVKVYKDTNTAACHKCPDPNQKARKFDVMDAIQEAEHCDYNTALQIGAGILGIEIVSDNARIESGWKSHKGSRTYTTPAEDFAPDNENGPEIGPNSQVNTGEHKTPTDTEKTPEQGQNEAGSLSSTGTSGSGPDFTAYYRECAGRITDPAAAAYITGRGISIETAKKYWIGYDPKADPANAPGTTGDQRRPHPWPRVITPITEGHYIGHRIDGKKEYKKINNAGAKIGIFNAREGLRPAADQDQARPVFIVEGVWDALSILEIGAQAIALNSTSNVKLLLETIDQTGARGPFILALDTDQAGREATEKLKSGFGARELPHIIADINGGQNDPNDALIADRARFEADIKKAQEEAIEKSNRDELTDFLEIIQTEAYKPHQTGLSFFDDLLAGGVVRQMVVLIMAAPGAGKTTLCQQIAEEMARRKTAVIFLNLEMSREQMLAKAISAQIAAAQKGRMTAADVLQGYRWTPEQRQIVTETIQEYRQSIFPYMKYNPEGVGTDLNMLGEYLNRKGQEAEAKGETAPAVVLDYLHLVSTSKGLDVQELIKQTMVTIKDYCKLYKTFAIVVSATNRTSNTTGRITLESGRDSSNIEYGGDAQISLNYWEVDQGEVDPRHPDEMGELQARNNRRMILRVLKSRFSPPGRFARIWFNAPTNRFYGENDFIPADIAEDAIPFDKKADDDPEKYDVNNLELPDHEEDQEGTEATKKKRRPRKGRNSI